MRKDSFYSFFLRGSIPDRRAAASAVVAGAVAGGLLTATFGAAALLRAGRYGWEPRTTVVLTGLAILFLIITIGTWKGLLLAATSGLVASIGVLLWAVAAGQTIMVIVIVIPIVGGFFTATRGIKALAYLRGRQAARQPDRRPRL